MMKFEQYKLKGVIVKKYFKSIIAIFVCFMICFLNTMVVNAATTEELKEQWYDTNYYPIHPGNDFLGAKYDYADFLDILNPPLDLLLSMSTEELAKLMQTYPLLMQMTTYFGEDGKLDYRTLFGFLELNCDIFYELLRRGDGFTYLLKEFQTHELDVEKLNENVYSDQMFYRETFGCQFIRYYVHHFTKNEYLLASQIIEEKKELYLLLDDSLLNYFDLPEIEPPTEVRTNYLFQSDIKEKEDKLAAALIQMQSKENSLQAVTPDTEDNNIANRKVMIVVGTIIGMVCVIGGFVLIRRRRKGNERV